MLLYQNTSEHKLRIQKKVNLNTYCMSKNQLFSFLPNFIQNANDETIVHEGLWTWKS